MTEPDAWQQLHDLMERHTRRWTLRDDLEVFAHGPERSVMVNGIHHNVGTVKEYIAMLEAACDFVEAANPEWTGGARDAGPPVELECEAGHLTYGRKNHEGQRCAKSYGKKFEKFDKQRCGKPLRLSSKEQSND